jgi:hypothetical protein
LQHVFIGVAKKMAMRGTLVVCCCGTQRGRPHLWLAFCFGFFFAACWVFGFSLVYSNEWLPLGVRPVQWYHASAIALFMAAGLVTIGARLYLTEEELDAEDDQDGDSAVQCIVLDRYTLQMLRLLLIMGLWISGCAMTFLWTYRDWLAAPTRDSTLAYAMVLQAVLCTCGLLCRRRQLVLDYELFKARGEGTGIDDERL